MKRKVELIAHRGANREAPENSIRAFQRALELGVDGIELDIQLTRDGVPVIHHDPALAPASPGSPREPIASLPLSAIRERTDVPTLDEVLDLVAGRCRLYVEIKDAEAVGAVVHRLADRTGWCAVHSFDHRASARAATLNGSLPTGILLVSRLVDTAGAMRAAQARDVWQRAEFVDGGLVDEVHAAGGRVIAWTVNDAAECRRLIALGVDGVCTDEARALRAVVTAAAGS